jgi:hypothetical protein
MWEGGLAPPGKINRPNRESRKGMNFNYISHWLNSIGTESIAHAKKKQENEIGQMFEKNQ